MFQRNISFSVKEKDTDGVELVHWFKIYSIRTGITFTHLVLAALKIYKQHLESKSNG